MAVLQQRLVVLLVAWCTEESGTLAIHSGSAVQVLTALSDRVAEPTVRTPCSRLVRQLDNITLPSASLNAAHLLPPLLRLSQIDVSSRHWGSIVQQALAALRGQGPLLHTGTPLANVVDLTASDSDLEPPSTGTTAPLRCEKQDVGAIVAVSAVADTLPSENTTLRHRPLPRRSYEAMDKEMLVDLLCHRDQYIATLREELSIMRRRSAKQSDTEHPGALRDAENDLNSDFQITRRGQKQEHFSLQGQLAIAIRRNLTNLAAKDLGACILTDISQQSVVRFELLLEACHIASCRAFHAHEERKTDTGDTCDEIRCNQQFCLAQFETVWHGVGGDVCEKHKWHNGRGDFSGTL